MTTVVITGGTRGLGLGLATAFLERDCRVFISGRTKQSVDAATSPLAAKFGADRIDGAACDVGDYDQVRALWDAAAARFGVVDLWINNAGAAHAAVPVWSLEAETIGSVVDTNIKGLLYGCKVAISGMTVQGHGRVFNVEGYGSSGSMRGEMPVSVYGASKYAVRYISRSLKKELDRAGSPVQIGTISPGMLATEMLTKEYIGKPDDWARASRIFNIIAEPVEKVAPWLVERMLGSTRSGAWISWLNTPKLIAAFLRSPFVKRDLFPDFDPMQTEP